MLKSFRFKTFVLSVLFFVIIMLGLVFSLSGQLLRWYVPKYLQGVGVSAEIAEVNLLLLDSKLEIKRLNTTASDNRRLSLQYLAVDWQWQGLMARQFVVDSVTVEGLVVDVVSQDGKPVSIGSLDLTQFTTANDEVKQQSDARNDKVTLKQLNLDDIELCSFEAGQQQCIKWQQLALDGDIVVSNQQPLKTALDIELKQLDLAAVVGEDKATLRLEHLSLNDVDFNLANQVGHIASIDIANISAGLAEHQLVSDALHFGALNLHLQGAVKLAVAKVNHLKVTQSSMPLVAFEQLQLGPMEFDLHQFVGKVDGADLTGLAANVADFAVNTDGVKLGRLDLHPDSGLHLVDSKVMNLTVNQSSNPLLAVEQVKVALVNHKPVGLVTQMDGVSVTKAELWQLSRRERFDKLLAVAQLNIAKVAIDQHSQKLTGVKLDSVGLMTILSLDSTVSPNKNNESMLVTVNSLNLSQLSHGAQIQLGDLVLAGLDANVLFDKEQGLNLAGWLAPATSDQSIESADNKPQPAKPIHVASVSLNQGSQLVLRENTQGKLLTHQLTDIDLAVNNIQLFAEPKPMDIQLAALVNEAGKLNVSGQLVPDGNFLSVALKTRIKHLPLTPYSLYSEKNIGYRIDQGQGNVDVDLMIKGKKIDSDIAVKLNKFELGELQQNEKSELNQELGLPLPLALNLLRDSDDNIELSTEIKGSLDDPSFSLADIVETVSLKALKSALLYAYSPLGFVTVTSGIIDLATAMRFNPVEFAPQVVDLNDEQRQRLKKVAQVMTDKPKVSLVLCANATQTDFIPQTEAQSEQRQVFDPNNIEPLLALANQRQTAVQQYLHLEFGIATERLLLCNVKLDKDAQALAKVEISL